MWLNEFKAALAERDPDRIDALLQELPEFETLEQMKEAAFLMEEAYRLLETLKLETAKTMQQLQKNRDYLRSTYSDKNSELDISL